MQLILSYTSQRNLWESIRNNKKNNKMASYKSIYKNQYQLINIFYYEMYYIYKIYVCIYII